MATWLQMIGVQARQSPPEYKTPQKDTERKTDRDSARELAGKRIAHVRPNEEPFFNVSYPVEPISADDRWRDMDLDSETLSRMSPAQLLELLSDISPDISRALWDFLRFCNPGYTATAKIGDKAASDQQQAALNAVLDTFKARHGSFDVALSRLFIGAFLRGAFMAELVLDKTGRKPIDLAIPDPGSIRFLQVNDPEYGLDWKLGQYQNGEWIRLDSYDTVRYLPIDPVPGSPYGRAIAAPALFTTLFLIGLMHDLRRVVSQQGYPRIDLTVNMERLQASMPEDLAEDPEARKLWLAAILAEIKSVYGSLEPDDAYVHSDVISVGRPVGAIDSGSLGAIGTIISNLERQLARALKTMPLLMGITDGVSEANANRQYEIHVAGIKSIQHLAENLLEHLLGIALRVQGVPAIVEFRFSEIRAAEVLRDAQAEQLKITNAKSKFDNGWITLDEASNEATGHDAAQKQPTTAELAAAAVQGILSAAQASGAENGAQQATGDSSGDAPTPDEPTANKVNADPGADRMIEVLNELRASRGDLIRALEGLVNA